MPLSTIIDDGDLDGLQKILSDHDDRGTPKFNVNQNPYPSALHYILFTKHPPEIKRAMIQKILDLRDNDNNVIADLNIFHPDIGTVLTAAIAKNDLVLVQQILNVRNQDGTLAANLSGGVNPGDFFFPLTRALFLNRLEIVQFLINARHADRSPFYTEVELRETLDSVHKAVNNYPTTDSTIWLHLYLDELTELNAFNALINALNALDEFDPPFPIEEEVNRNFFNNPQNTHASEVTISVENSTRRLLERYKTIVIPANLLECENYIKTSNIFEKQYALDFIERIKKINLNREPIGISLSYLLALVWTGIKDKTANASGEETLLEDKDIVDRKNNLICNLIAAQTSALCFVGIFNKILESLDRIHPDVTFFFGSEMILPVATERAQFLVEKALLRKPLKEVESILSTWNDLDSGASKTKATEFRESMVAIVNRELLLEFKSLLTELQRAEITSQFEYLPCPNILPKGFEQLIKKIKDISLDDKEDYEKAYILHLKFLTDEIYPDNGITFEELHDKIRNKYDVFKTLEFIKEFGSTYESNNSYNLAAITTIKNYYFFLQDNNFEFSDSKALAQLITHLGDIRKDVHSNWMQHSELRSFPFLKPKSPFLEKIDSVLKKLIMIKVTTREGKHSTVEEPRKRYALTG